MVADNLHGRYILSGLLRSDKGQVLALARPPSHYPRFDWTETTRTYLKHDQHDPRTLYINLRMRIRFPVFPAMPRLDRKPSQFVLKKP